MHGQLCLRWAPQGPCSQAGRETLRRQEDLSRLPCWPEAALGTSGAGGSGGHLGPGGRDGGLGCFTFRAARQRRGSGGASSGGGGSARTRGRPAPCRSGAGLRGSDKGCGAVPFSQVAFVCLVMCFLSVFVYGTQTFAGQQIPIFLRVARHLFSGEWGVSAVTWCDPQAPSCRAALQPQL